MPSVCFTGRGEINGRFMVRDQLERMAISAGWEVHDKVQPWTDYLVASRQDTTKATAARRLGTKVMPYGWFLSAVAADSNSYAPQPQPAAPAPKPIDYTAMQEHEAWGLF